MSPVSDLEGLENEFKEGLEQLAAAYKKLQAAKLRSFDDKGRVPEIRNAQKSIEETLAKSSELAKSISPFYDKAYVVLLDICARFGSTLRDILFEVSWQRAHRPQWSDATLAELEQKLRRKGWDDRCIIHLNEKSRSAILAAISDARVDVPPAAQPTPALP